jgi:hypothetical protein
VVVLTVMAEVVLPPGLEMAAGEVAATENTDVVTFTGTVLFPGA